jgi:hypothetical protein
LSTPPLLTVDPNPPQQALHQSSHLDLIEQVVEAGEAGERREPAQDVGGDKGVIDVQQLEQVRSGCRTEMMCVIAACFCPL